METIVKEYEGTINKTIFFKSVPKLDLIIINNKVIKLLKNSNRYGRLKFRNHIMDHIHKIMINENYKLKRIRNNNTIFTLWKIHDSWKKIDISNVILDDDFIIKNFNDTINKCYLKLNNIYKKKFYIWCFLYVNGGFYVGNEHLRLNYPLEFFIKKINVVVLNTLNNTIYEDFFYFSQYNTFLLAIIKSVAILITSNRYLNSYDILFGGKLFIEIFNSKPIFSENTQILKLDSFIKTDLDKYCNYCWINKNNKLYDRYIDITVKDYRDIQKTNELNWRMKKIFKISL